MLTIKNISDIQDNAIQQRYKLMNTKAKTLKVSVVALTENAHTISLLCNKLIDIDKILKGE